MDISHPCMTRTFGSFLPSKEGNHTTTILYADLPFIVNYDYSPPERQTHMDPGCPASVEVCSIKLQGDPHDYEFHQIFDAGGLLDEIEEKILQQLGEY